MPLRRHLPLLLAGLGLCLGGFASAEDPAPPAAPPPAPPPPVTYKLDPAKSLVYVQVFKDPTTMAAGLSHDHVVVAKGWSGSFTWDPANPAACKGEVHVPVAQLDNDAPDMRKKVGYDTELDASGRADVKEHMLGEDQLNAAKFPTIDLVISSCAGASPNVKASGTLTMHGKSKAVTIPVNLSATPTNLSAAGSFTVNHSDFGMEPFSAMFGQLKNKQELKFTVKAVGRP